MKIHFYVTKSKFYVAMQNKRLIFVIYFHHSIHLRKEVRETFKVYIFTDNMLYIAICLIKKYVH